MKAASAELAYSPEIPAPFANARTYGIFLMLFSTLFFSFMGALGKLVAARIPFLEITFFRALVSALVLVPRLVWRGTSFTGVNRRGLALRGVSGFIAVALSFYVIARIDLASASVLNQSSPIFVAVLSVFVLRESPSWRLVCYIAAAFAGVTLIVKPSAGVFNPAAIAGLASGFCAAIAYVTVKKLHATDENDTIVFYFSWVTSVLSLVCAFFPLPFGIQGGFVMPTAPEFAVLITLGLFGTVAQLAMTASYKYAHANVVSPFSFATALFSALWGFVFWNEVPDAFSLIGGLLVVACGIGIIRLKESRGMPMEFQGLR